MDRSRTTYRQLFLIISGTGALLAVLAGVLAAADLLVPAAVGAVIAALGVQRPR